MSLSICTNQDHSMGAVSLQTTSSSSEVAVKIDVKNFKTAGHAFVTIFDFLHDLELRRTTMKTNK